MIGAVDLPANRAGRQWSLAKRIFFSVWMVHSLFWAPFLLREHFPALALAERGSFNVERYAGWCEDIFPGPHGGAYINNNPGASLTAALPLAAAMPLINWLDRNHNTSGRLWSFQDRMFETAAREGRGVSMLLAAFVSASFVNALSNATLAAFLGMRLLHFGVGSRWAAGICLLYSFGTPIFFRAGYLNHNLLVANAGLFALLLLWRPDNRPVTAGTAGWAGLLCGYAVLCDFSGLVVAAVAGGYLLSRVWEQPRAERFRASAAFVCAMAPGLLGLILYQWNSFGNPLFPSQHYMPPTAPTAQGYRGFDWPSPTLAWANFFHPEFGLFAYCPLLVLGLAAPFVRNAAHRIPKRETAVLFAYFVIFVIFCSANRYSWLQWSTGLRYLIPVVPALFLLAMRTLQALPRWLRYVLATVSLLESGASALTRQNHVGVAIADALQAPFRIVWMERMVAMGVLPAWTDWGTLLMIGATLILAIIWVPFWRQGTRTPAP